MTRYREQRAYRGANDGRGVNGGRGPSDGRGPNDGRGTSAGRGRSTSSTRHRSAPSQQQRSARTSRSAQRMAGSSGGSARQRPERSAQLPNTTRHNARKQRRPWLIAGVIAVLFIIGIVNFTCSATTDETGALPYYDWEGFQQRSGRYLYAKDGKVAAKTGIDVSDHQGEIDWHAVKEDGIRFAIVRIGYRGATEGKLYQDAYYAQNLSAAAEEGIERGAYFFSQAITVEEAREEARFALELLGGTQLEYPVVFDYEMKASGIESRVDGISSETATDIAQAFCDTIKKGGYTAMVYGNNYDLGHYNLDKLEGIPLWFAEYGALPSFTREYVLWQYDPNGAVNGIATNVDMNLDLSAV